MANKLIEQLLGGGGDFPRLSAKEVVILRVLSPSGEKYGLQIVTESEGGVGRGTVYVTLSRMEEKGFVESRQEAQAAGATGLPRRMYRISGEGSRVLRAWERAANVLARAGLAT